MANRKLKVDNPLRSFGVNDPNTNAVIGACSDEYPSSFNCETDVCANGSQPMPLLHGGCHCLNCFFNPINDDYDQYLVVKPPSLAERTKCRKQKRILKIILLSGVVYALYKYTNNKTITGVGAFLSLGMFIKSEGGWFQEPKRGNPLNKIVGFCQE